MQITTEERIYGLSLLWKEAAYNFAYWDERPELDWDKAYTEFLPKVIAAEEPLRYYSELMRFIALLKDGHSYVNPPNEIKPPYAVPFGTSFVEGKHVANELPADSGVPLYSEILAVNGVPLADYLEKYIHPYIYHEKPDGVFFNGQLGYAIG